jgi:hypothetical protein
MYAYDSIKIHGGRNVTAGLCLATWLESYVETTEKEM